MEIASVSVDDFYDKSVSKILEKYPDSQTVILVSCRKCYEGRSTKLIVNQIKCNYQCLFDFCFVNKSNCDGNSYNCPVLMMFRGNLKLPSIWCNNLNSFSDEDIEDLFRALTYK